VITPPSSPSRTDSAQTTAFLSQVLYLTVSHYIARFEAVMSDAKALAGVLSDGAAISNVDTISGGERILVGGKPTGENRAHSVPIGKDVDKAMVEGMPPSEIVFRSNMFLYRETPMHEWNGGHPRHPQPTNSGCGKVAQARCIKLVHVRLTSPQY
jgi:hypothetical protein